MSYLNKTIERVVLPSDNNYWVDVEKNFKYGDIKNLGTGLEGTEASDKLLSLAIKEWNLDDEAGNVLEISQENIDQLKQDDVVAIIKAVDAGAGDTAEKKDS